MKHRACCAGISLLVVFLAWLAAPTFASLAQDQAPLDYGMISAVRQEELNHSQVMRNTSWIAATTRGGLRKTGRWGAGRGGRRLFPERFASSLEGGDGWA